MHTVPARIRVDGSFRDLVWAWVRVWGKLSDSFSGVYGTLRGHDHPGLVLCRLAGAFVS